MPAARPQHVANARKGDLAAIHIAKAALGLQDDEYRDLMATVCNGVRSAGELDWTGRRRFLAHLQACLRQRGQTQARKSDRPIKDPLTPQQRKMWALWMRLADVGAVNERTMHALQAWVCRQTGVDRLEWLNTHQEGLVLASLRSWVADREDRAR